MNSNTKTRSSSSIKALLFFALALILVLSLCLVACQKFNQTKIGVGSVGAQYYTTTQNLEKASKGKDGFSKVEITETEGSLSTLKLLSKNYLSAAWVQSDVLQTVKSYPEYFPDVSLDGLCAVFKLYEEPVHIAVRKSANINSVSDLRGKRVNLGSLDSGTYSNAREVLDAYNLTEKDMQSSNQSVSDSVVSFINGELDCIFVTEGIPSYTVSNLADSADIKFISLDEQSISRILSRSNCYSAITIPANSYKGQTEAVRTLAAQALLVTRNDTSNEQVKELFNSIYSSEFQKLEPLKAQAYNNNVKFLSEHVSIGFHQAAVDYFASQGISVQGQDGKRNTLLEIHSQY